MTEVSSLPGRVESPDIYVEDGLPRTACQSHTRDWIAGQGFVFAYCEGRQRYVVSWTVMDRWHTRRQLRLCRMHGEEFAELNGLSLDTKESAAPANTAAAKASSSDGGPDRAEAPSAARDDARGGGTEAATSIAPASPSPDVEDPFADADLDQPFSRVRAAQG